MKATCFVQAWVNCRLAFNYCSYYNIYECSLSSKDTWITLLWLLVNRSVLRIKTDNFLSIEKLLLKKGATLVIQTHHLQLAFHGSLCHLVNIAIKRSFLFLWLAFYSVKKGCWYKTVLLLSRRKYQTQLLFLKDSIKRWFRTGSISGSALISFKMLVYSILLLSFLAPSLIEGEFVRF